MKSTFVNTILEKCMFIKNCAFLIFFFFYINAKSQDCNSKFEANAGPDIDVCEDGQVNLDGMIGGEATNVHWKGGAGIFTPNRETLQAHYVPAPEEFGKDIVLTLEANNPSLKCPSVTSTTLIRVNSQPEVNAGGDQEICKNEKVLLKGTVKGRAKSLSWKTNGSGKFDNSTNANANYTPSENDIAQGVLTLELTAEPFGYCNPSTDAMILKIAKAPELITTPDIFIKAGELVNLSAKSQNTDELFWVSEGSGAFSDNQKPVVTYSPSSEDISKEPIYIYANLKYADGKCINKSKIKVHIIKKTNSN